MMKNQEKYIASLENFLEHSNEDKTDIDGVFKQLPFGTIDKLQGQKNIKILDVGSGNGAKAIYFADLFFKKGLDVRIDSLEPRAKQRHKLRIKHENEGKQYAGQIYPTTLGQAKISKTYDFVLLIHSLYEFPRNDDGTIDCLDNIPRLLKPHGLGIIIIEDADGDFQKLKNRFYPALGKKSPVSERIIIQTLESQGIKYKKGGRIDFEFSLGDIASITDHELGKNMEFLFSDTLTNSFLSGSELSDIGIWVKKHAHHDGDSKSTFLRTPDTVFWIYKN
ncbi:MAG: class I SAM-dependent methyltransferase [Desulfobacteraceae bacterium]|nr:class I SAM-dependent methyltransferase [Desulfobacteraceae bacterium]